MKVRLLGADVLCPSCNNRLHQPSEDKLFLTCLNEKCEISGSFYELPSIELSQIMVG